MLKKKKRDKHNVFIGLCSKAMILLVSVIIICEFDITDDHSCSRIVVNITDRLIKASVISLRFDVHSKN